jgi:histone H1/5
MADVNKSVEITLRANLKQLEEGLKNIPNMTKKEAQAMTRSLASEFNKAQKAAKKAAEESKKAAKATSAAYEQSGKKVGASFDKVAQDAKAAAHEVKISFEDAATESNQLAEGAETLGTSMGAATLAVDKLIPGLDEGAKKGLEMADGLATAAEQAIKGGPATMALTAAVVAGTAAYNLYTRSTQLAAAQQKRLAEAQKEANEKLDEQFSIVQSITGDFKDANREYQLLTGQITQLEFDLGSARDRSTEKTRQELEIQEKRIKEQERLVTILDKAQQSTSKLSAQERELLNTAMAISDNKLVQKGIDAEGVTSELALLKFRGELLGRLQKERDFANAIVNRREQALQAEEKLIKAKDEYNKEAEEEEKRQERLAKAEVRRLEALARIQQIQAVGQSLADKRIASEDRARQIFISTLDPQQQIIEQTKMRKEEIDETIEKINQEIAGAKALAKTDADRTAASEVRAEGERTIAALIEERQVIEEEGEIRLDELRQQNSDKNKERIKSEDELRKEAMERQMQELNMQQEAVIGTFRNTTNAIGAIMKATGQENANTIKALFEMNKVASLGEIAFNTAKAITAAQAYPPPFNGIMIASAVAAGAAQGATVLSQRAPEFHMGGMTPDESIAVVKAGEAVLDRATVDRLGGEPGVNRLQNGQGGSPEVIVMNPYKHFDRYMTDRQRAGLSSRSARRGY